MKTSPITWAIIRILTRRGKRHVKELCSNCARAGELNRELLMRIVHDNRDTEYGRKYHFDQIHSVEDYKRLVPLSNYDSYAPYIERMILTNLSGFYRYRIKDVVKVLGYESGCPRITFSYRKSQLMDLAGEKITEAMMDEAIRRTGEELKVNIVDYCVYPNRDISPSHYEFLIEPERQLDPARCGEYLEILERHLGEVNPVYKEELDTNEIDHGVLFLQQEQTHALWRELRIQKGASLNQVKPVRVLDTPMKKQFFYALREE